MDMLPRPETLYSLSKVFGEGLAYIYASQHGLEVVAVRIGNFRLERDQPEHPHHLSHGDAARVFERAIIAPLDQLEVPFAVVFGVSNSNWPLYDLEHGRRAIGYDPQDFADVPRSSAAKLARESYLGYYEARARVASEGAPWSSQH